MSFMPHPAFVISLHVQQAHIGMFAPVRRTYATTVPLTASWELQAQLEPQAQQV